MIQIYKIVLVPSTIIYIEKTSMSLQDRWHSHVYKRDKCLYDIIHTYGVDNRFYGHTHTDKVKKIISIANKNKTLSDAHKNKISNGLRGKYTGCDSLRLRNICVNKSSAA